MAAEPIATDVRAPGGIRTGIAKRTADLDWRRIENDLDAGGAALTGPLLSAGECKALVMLYARSEVFRNRIVMERHGFGQGEYRYFAYPLPTIVAKLRAAFYERLVDIANRWHTMLGIARRFPPLHAQFREQCHAIGQSRPTPLLLRYGAGDYNCLHQDIYGEYVFPLQLTLLLSEPERDFRGGEFVLTEQRPRMQSRAEVVPLRRGEAVIFAVRDRPKHGTRGVYRVNLRHGVSRVRSGKRYTCGIIFHDAT